MTSADIFYPPPWGRGYFPIYRPLSGGEISGSGKKIRIRIRNTDCTSAIIVNNIPVPVPACEFAAAIRNRLITHQHHCLQLDNVNLKLPTSRVT
jgi:hypothetical protein